MIIFSLLAPRAKDRGSFAIRHKRQTEREREREREKERERREKEKLGE